MVGPGTASRPTFTCGSELLIYVRPKSTDSHELLSSFVVSVTETYRRGSKITVASRALVPGRQRVPTHSGWAPSPAAGEPRRKLAPQPFEFDGRSPEPGGWTTRPAASASVATCAALHARSIPSVKSYSPNSRPPRDHQRWTGRFQRSIDHPDISLIAVQDQLGCRFPTEPSPTDAEPPAPARAFNS